MAPILKNPPPSLTLTPEPFTRESFAPFGTAVYAPLPRHLNAAPTDLSSLPIPPHTSAPVLANQSSALKYSPVAPFTNDYAGCGSGKTAEARMSMFACFPRKLRMQDGGGKVFDVRILERHPFTTQTFTPVDLSSQRTAGGDEEPEFLVVVAPSLKGEVATATVTTEDGRTETRTIRDPPNLKNLRAFVARGGQSVTYGVGTWHAPMVVLGKRRVDFVVVQFVNGVDEEDCQEAAFGEGVVVDLKTKAKLWEKSKL